jgi:Bacterial TSP3 repeat
MQLRLLGFVAAVSLVVTTTTCTLPETRKTITNSYRLARFRLEQCHRMGAGELDHEQIEFADRLSAETEAMVAAERWTAAKGSLTHLEETLARLLDRLKTWDPDGDGLSTYAEFVLYGTSWSDPDTDGDGYLDGTEVLVYETDPLDPCAVPIGVEPGKARTRLCPCLERVQSSAPP